MNRHTILIIGAGMVGSSAAAAITARRLGSVFLYDIAQDISLGRAMDINHALPLLGNDSYVKECVRLEDAGYVDIVVIAAGKTRKAGMTRYDLLEQNAEVVGTLAPRIASLYPDAMVLLVTNPVDVLTSYFKQLCPTMKVFGLGCSLDMVRFRHLISRAAKVSADSVSAMVIGSHDDNMIPLVSHATIGGVPLDMVLGEHDIGEIIEKTRTAGSTIVKLLKRHSGHYAAGEVIAQIVEAMAQDRGMIFPVSVGLVGEYGYDGICLAVPCIVGSTGVREIIELELTEQEQAALNICALSIAHQVSSLKGPPAPK